MIIFSIFFFFKRQRTWKYILKKIKVLSLKLFAMRRFKNESWYFYTKSELKKKTKKNLVKCLIFETQTPSRRYS